MSAASVVFSARVAPPRGGPRQRPDSRRPMGFSPARATVRSPLAPPPRSSPPARRRFLALDFDGVVCDSEPESSISGWKHGVELWPDVFSDETQRDRVLAGLKKVRPVVETGFENTILARALLEELPGHSADDIIANWGGLMPGLMSRWGLDRAEMVAGYGKIRDDWMEADLAGWLAPNLIYPGVAEACIAAEESDKCDLYVVTTKQARFASAIMERRATRRPGQSRLLADRLRLAQDGRPRGPGRRRRAEREKIFVEDKLSTLEKVCACDS